MEKSSLITTFSFGLELCFESVRGLRRRATTDVIPGDARARERTSPPMKPLAPVMMSFIIAALREFFDRQIRYN